MEYFKNARTRSLTNIDIMISIIPGSVFKVKKIIIVSKINRFKSARIGGVVITMFEFVIYLKALATILITNSRFDTIYPISQLSMGGSIGNSIFFWVSGFCLSNIKSRGSIVVDGGAWYLHRLWRIYLPCVVAVLINTFYRYMIHIATPNLKEILGNIVNPTVGFWFVQAILVLYILYYITVRLLDNGTLSFKVVFITIGIIYTISYVLCVDKSYVSIERDSLFKWIYYFAVMMLGFYCKKKKRSNAQNKVSLLIVCSAMFVIFYGLQFVIKRCTVLLPFQFIIHVEEVVFIYYITYLFENLESFFIKIKHKTAISKIADSLAKITLEIYLVQMVVIDLCAEHLAFPLSFVVAVVGIYVYAIIVNSISTQVRRIVEKIVIRKKKAKI